MCDISIVTAVLILFWMPILATEATFEERFVIFYFVAVFCSLNAATGAGRVALPE